MPYKKLLVCDLDNTLYDWVHYFVVSFYDMVDEVVTRTSCDRDVLLDDFRKVHRMHHDSEHPFSLLETDTVIRLFPGRQRSEIAKVLDPAFHAFNSRRKRELKLHAGVRETLDQLQQEGVVLVAHTESKLFSTVDRLLRLDLTKFFDRVYCRERSDTPHPSGMQWLDRFPIHGVVELSQHQTKPDPSVLREICSDQHVTVEDAAYVGDSLARDILMAKEAGVFAIWAKYGAQHDEGEYKKLVRISHWTERDIRTEIELNERAKNVRPDFVLENSFAELSRLFLSGHPKRATA